MKWYKIFFKQNQPIHIGTVEWGVINETEIFIPGWTMWGALTNQFLKTNGFNKIDESKKIFEKITNFYPAIGQVEKDSPEPRPLFPQYKGGVLSLGDYSEEKFKFEFVDTIVSTAIEHVLRSAKDESLHEFEYILPKSKMDLDNKTKQLYWVGLIGFEDYNNFLKDSPKIYIGGDIKYGFGELELFNSISINEVTKEELNQWNITENGCLFFDDKTNINQFLKFSPNIKFEGELKLLAEFEFTQNIPRIKDAAYFINVGSKILNFNEIDLSKYHLIKGKFIKID